MAEEFTYGTRSCSNTVPQARVIIRQIAVENIGLVISTSSTGGNRKGVMKLHIADSADTWKVLTQGLESFVLLDMQVLANILELSIRFLCKEGVSPCS